MVSTNDEIPILLSKGSQRTANTSPKEIINIPEFLKLDFLGKKLIIEF